MEVRYITPLKFDYVIKMLEEIGCTPVKKSSTPHEKGREPHNELTLTRGEEVKGRCPPGVPCYWTRFYKTIVYTMRGDPREPEEYFTVIRTDDPRVEKLMSKISNRIRLCDPYFYPYYDEVDKTLREWL
jgi:hypothetical protein